jgi:DNA helicase-2/ATP-dependent DNA helicase PcrA
VRTRLDDDAPVHLLTASSTTFRQGVVLCTAHAAEGLEFDEVIVPDAEDANFSPQTGRHLLHIACTRALRRLTRLHVGPLTRFLHQSGDGQAAAARAA